VVFEETGAYQYKKNKEMERGQSSGGGETGARGRSGLQQGFEEIFSFGENDDTDYLHFKDGGVEIVD
jgi:ribosomal protein L15